MGIKVDDTIPYFNACDLSIVEGKETVEVSFAADPHGGPESLWFCFRLVRDGLVPSQRVKLILKHPSSMLGAGKPSNMRPVVRYAEGDWRRLDAGTVEELPDGRKRVSWIVRMPETFLDVAYCYPYGMPEIEGLLRETGSYWRTDTIGVSQEGRPLIRLSNGYGGVGDDRPGLYLMARQHSGETPGSWVLDGFLRYIATLGDEAPLVWAVLLANVDGVERGDYGKDNFPYDLNRAWGNPPMRHEALVFQRDIRRWKERCKPVLAIDFHAPGACESEGIYCFLPNPEDFPERHREALEWTAAIEGALTSRYAARSFCRVADYPSRWETPTFASYLCGVQGICGFTVETPYALAGDLILTRERYQEAGRLMASGVIEKIKKERSNV